LITCKLEGKKHSAARIWGIDFQNFQFWDSPDILLINQGVTELTATLQERRLGYHSQSGLQQGTES
jgi:hypothetical protein